MAYVTITPNREDTNVNSAPVIEANEIEAREHGETTIQLRESESYEYEVFPANEKSDLRLRCSLSRRRCTLASGDAHDAGVIETRSYCGALLLDLIDGEVTDGKSAVASALVEVRSLKLHYRTEYRGMLRRLAEELVGLVVDARSSTKVAFRSSFEERKDEGWLQVQVELLREMLDGAEFSSALSRIMSFPHEVLSAASQVVGTDRAMRCGPSVARQLISGNPRRLLPAESLLRERHGLDTIAERVTVPVGAPDFDTPANRFVKYVLRDFVSFLTRAQGTFESRRGWGASAALARRLTMNVEEWLGHGLMREVGELRFVPLGSPVLQRKTGYREVLRWWLRFRTAAELSWDGGEDLFRAGQRDVSKLYEYWLFFELLEWFCRRCRNGNRPAVEELVAGLENGLPRLKLGRQQQLGPFLGLVDDAGRRLSARFTYNQRFEVTEDRAVRGSWTRRLHPDYTLTFWPESLTEEEAESKELLAHIHFDAKYRIDDIESLFGAEDDDSADEEKEGNYKRQDLMKMHAYRDAIRRSEGAYVLYPGRGTAAKTFKGFFHELLPGLGAFAVAPDEDGVAQGMNALAHFLDDVLVHLGNRTTARERITYHVAKAYSVSDGPVEHRPIRWSEADIYSDNCRALPPAEHLVLVASSKDDADIECAEANHGVVCVEIACRKIIPYIHPDLAQVRHVVMIAGDGAVIPGLLSLREPGFRVCTRSQLCDELVWRALGSIRPDKYARVLAKGEEPVYAVFLTRRDSDYAGQEWSRAGLNDAIRDFESDARNTLGVKLPSLSVFPRVLPLRSLLKAI